MKNIFLISKVLKRDDHEYFCVGKYLVKMLDKFKQGEYLTEDKNNKTREILVMSIDEWFVRENKDELIIKDEEIILNLISKDLELFPGIMLFKRDIVDPELEEILSEAHSSIDIIKREYSCDEVDCELLEARDKYINLLQTPRSQRIKKQE